MEFSHIPIQNYVLKVHLQCCETCPGKVKKMLQRIEGVYSISMDVPRGMVTVSGKANPTLLIKMLEKSGKKADLVSIQMDSMHDRNKLDNHFKNLHISQGHGFYNDKNYPQYGRERTDQQYCATNDRYYNYHDGNCHSNEYNFCLHCVCKMKHLNDKDNRPKMIWTYPHYNTIDHNCPSRDSYEYGTRCPPCGKYGENGAYGTYDMPQPFPGHNYFQPQPAPRPQPGHNDMNHCFSDGNANGCSVM